MKYTILTTIFVCSLFFGYYFCYNVGFHRGLNTNNPSYIVGEGVRVTYDIGSDTMRVEIDEEAEEGINFTYKHSTNTLIMHDPIPADSFWHKKEWYLTCFPDGKPKTLITYKASQNLKHKMKQYAFSQ